jgi:hypothetical protein
VEGQDAQRLLDHPALGLGDEAPVAGVALHDVHVDAHGGAMGDDRGLEPLVRERPGHRAALRGDLVQQGDPGRVVVR